MVPKDIERMIDGGLILCSVTVASAIFFAWKAGTGSWAIALLAMSLFTAGFYLLSRGIQRLGLFFTADAKEADRRGGVDLVRLRDTWRRKTEGR